MRRISVARQFEERCAGSMLIDSDEPTRSQVGGPNCASSDPEGSPSARSSENPKPPPAPFGAFPQKPARREPSAPSHAGFFGGTSFFFLPKCQIKKTPAAS